MEMNAREIIEDILTKKKKTKVWLAERMGWTPQRLGQRILRGTLNTDEFFEALEAMGAEIIINYEAEPVEEEKIRKGYGPRVVGMSDGVRFDTKYSNAVSNSFFADGENEYDEEGCACELYLDEEGRYFIAEYKQYGASSRVRTVPKAVVEAFAAQYGNIIDKRNIDGEEEAEEQ